MLTHPRRPFFARCLPERACPYLALVLILGAAIFHLAYLACDCPLDLAPDEAHYWDWSRHIDFSYYSKGPLVAWLIRLSCELFGAFSERFTGNLMFAIRLPAVVCGNLLLASLYQLTQEVFGRPRLSLAVVAVALTFPLIAAGSMLMTIDSPYTCCWGWALVFAYRAVTGRSNGAWEATGFLVGIGMLAKYNMAAFIPSLALFLATSREHRRLLFSAGFWSMTGITVAAFLPILVWNAQHDWVTFRHVNGLAGGDRSGLTPWGPPAYLAAQAGLLLGYWFFTWVCGMVAANPLTESDPGRRFLWWLSAPMFLIFFAFSIKTGGGEPNWPVAAYLSGGVLAAGWLYQQFQTGSTRYRWLIITAVALTSLAGLSVTAIAHHSESIHPLLQRISGPATALRPYPVRRFDPTCRLRGWRTLAERIDELRARLSEEGKQPVVAAYSWSVPGELGVYCAGHPQVYSIGLMQGDRHSQYDFWHNPIDHPEAFLGRSFIMVGDIAPAVRAAFKDVDEPIHVTHYDNGIPVAGWNVFVCHNFQGFEQPPKGKLPH